MLSPEQQKHYYELIEHAPEQAFKVYERLHRWYINALARVQRAEKERERWHGKYMMVKHENNKLRAKLHNAAEQCISDAALHK